MASAFCPTMYTGNKINNLFIHYGKKCDNGVFSGYASLGLLNIAPNNPNIMCGDATCVATFALHTTDPRSLFVRTGFASSAQPKLHKSVDANEVSSDFFSTEIAATTTVTFPSKLSDPTSVPVYVKLTQLLVDMKDSSGLLTDVIAIGWEIIEDSARHTVAPSQVTLVSPSSGGSQKHAAL